MTIQTKIIFHNYIKCIIHIINESYKTTRGVLYSKDNYVCLIKILYVFSYNI